MSASQMRTERELTQTSQRLNDIIQERDKLVQKLELHEKEQKNRPENQQSAHSTNKIKSSTSNNDVETISQSTSNVCVIV